MATHNAFGMTPAELDKRAETYFAAGHFVAVPLVGIPPGVDSGPRFLRHANSRCAPSRPYCLDSLKAGAARGVSAG